MQLTLNIDLSNAKALALLNYIRTLDFVNVEEDAVLTTEQKKAIDIGLESLKDGKGIKHDDVMKDTKNRYHNLFNNG